MGIFDTIANLFTESIQCPSCGTPGAKKSEDRIHCPKPGCVYYDPSRGLTYSPAPVQKEMIAQDNPRARQTSWEASASSALVIRYVNFRNESKTFRVDPASVKRKSNHILAREQSSGLQITLSRDRIRNMAEVDLALPEKDRSGVPRPSARELQVLGYHTKYKTTSPLYEKIRAKYPKW